MTGLYWDEDDGQEGLLTRRSSGHCLSEQEVEDFLFQRLSGVSREAVEEHLLFCETCRKRVEEEESFLEAVRGASERLELEAIAGPAGGIAAEGEARRRSWRPMWAMAAAAAVVFVAGTVSLRVFRPSGVTEVALRIERTAEASLEGAVPEGESLLLRADLQGLPPLSSLRWVVVDRSGRPVAEGSVAPEQETAEILLPRGLSAGLYWLRIQDPETGMLLREYGLHVRPRRQTTRPQR